MSKRDVFRNKIIYGPENPENKFFNGPDDEELAQRQAQEEEAKKTKNKLPKQDNGGKNFTKRLNGKRIFSDEEVADIIANNPETDLSGGQGIKNAFVEANGHKEDVAKDKNLDRYGDLDELPNKGSMRKQERFRKHHAKYDGDDGGRDTETDFYKKLKRRLYNPNTLNPDIKAMQQRKKYKADGTLKGGIHGDLLSSQESKQARDLKGPQGAKSYDALFERSEEDELI